MICCLKIPHIRSIFTEGTVQWCWPGLLRQIDRFPQASSQMGSKRPPPPQSTGSHLSSQTQSGFLKLTQLFKSAFLPRFSLQ